MVGDQYLLLPGPTPIPDRVKRAMSKPMINHRGMEFRIMLEYIIEELKAIHKTKGDIAIFPASGTGGLEAAIVNFVSPGDKVLSISSGVFGDRWAEIAENFGAQVERVDFPWGQSVDPQIIKEKLIKDTNANIKAILVTQNETSTGIYNDLKSIGEAIGSHPALLMVDAISGLATIDMDMDDWNLDVVISGSQKAFMIPPGIAIMAYNKKALAAHANCSGPRFYWDLTAVRKYLEKGQTSVTPPISLYFGLEEALIMFKEEGLENIISRHRNYRDIVRCAIKALGLELMAADHCASPTVTAVFAPPDIGANKIREMMYKDFNIVLAGGQQNLDNKIFRFGHLGYVRELDLVASIAALEITLSRVGYPVNLGHSVSKALECLKENIT